ncbi:MAG: DEAD/DEAH box helicase [Verrucomicrobiaceae bacterium]|nr:DEAD/DEAH box helicase [Verrucomicrobiaceae bacterium]
MKAARGLVAAGLVTVAETSENLFRGSAGSGRSRFSCGLRIRSKSDVDNLCTCPTSRGRGQICEHSLAVGIAALQTTPATAPRSAPIPVAKSAPQAIAEKEAPATLSVFLPELQSAARAGDRWNVFLKAEPGGKEVSRLAGWLASQRLPAQSAPLSLGGNELPEFLKIIADHPRIFMGRPPAGQHRQVQVVIEGTRLPIIVHGNADTVSLRFADPKLQLALSPGRESADNWWFAGSSGTLFHAEMPSPALSTILRELEAARGKPILRPLLWFAVHSNELGNVCQLTLEGDILARFHVLPVPCEFEFELDGSLQEAKVTVRASWEGHRWLTTRGTIFTDQEKDPFPIQDKTSIGSFYARNIELESAVLSRLKAISFVEDQGKWVLKGAPNVWEFLGSNRRRLAEWGKVIETERWRAATRGILRVAPILHTPASGGGESTGGQSRDWLTMEFSYQAPDGFKIGRNEILRMIRSGQKSVSGPNGKKYALDSGACEELEESFRDVPLQLTPTGAKIRPEHAFYFSPELREKAEKFEDLQGTEVSTVVSKIAELKDILRPYQLLGVTWLHRHAMRHAGAVLGDDMGLGKTIQTIALIRALYSGNPEEGGDSPSLVLCPKSLLGNWAAEFAKFAPEIPVVVVSGSDRKNALATIPAGCVVITSYPLIIRDLPAYQKLEFRVAALDEASFIRNPETEVSRAVCSLRAKFRVALTGTPVENGVRDLWSIFNFAVPGYLGTQSQFKERFEQPINSGLGSPASQDAATRLKRLVRPFFLRRTKREVLKDLPEKIEQVLWCEMSQGQGEVYRRVLEEGRDEIRASQKRSGQNGARMTMFTVLLRLRQVCCDLRLTGAEKSSLAGLSEEDLSGKWSVLGERLEEIQASGGKALIFSQFVQFLRLGSKYLEALNIDYCYLDGSTQDRAAQVNLFQSDPKKSVFLISLKAGGYGLNLTAADHVLLLDPWWNPAVEAQAIDRAHRIGQQRVVTASRLIMKGTVEERILKLQASKRGLVEATLDENSPLMAGLTDSDLQDLLL